MLDQNLVVGDLAEDQEAAIAQRGDPGQRGRGKPIPARRAGARFEPEVLGATQHLGDADRRGAAAVADLPRLGTDAVNAQQDDQRAQP